MQVPLDILLSNNNENSFRVDESMHKNVECLFKELRFGKADQGQEVAERKSSWFNKKKVSGMVENMSRAYHKDTFV